MSKHKNSQLENIENATDKLIKEIEKDLKTPTNNKIKAAGKTDAEATLWELGAELGVTNTVIKAQPTKTPEPKPQEGKTFADHKEKKPEQQEPLTKSQAKGN